MFYCQHVLGMGHLIRSLEIVRGLADFEVCFLNGGEPLTGYAPPPHVSVINLPPVRSDATFSSLHAADETQSLAEISAQRRQMLLAAYERFQPEALVIEMFPFGRRKFADELIPLLELARAPESRTRVACSLRDILVGKRDQQRFETEACRLANAYFDLVLIHSDPHFQRLEETFSLKAELRCPVVYTGFVSQAETQNADADDLPEVNDDERLFVVSIGGGRVGSELIRCAIAASALMSRELPHRLLIFTGPYLPEAEYQQLQTLIAGNPVITLRRYTTNLTAVLRRADLSLSLAGYNTCMNLLVSGTRAIVYPFTGNNNQEQTIRAEKLRALGLVEIIREAELQPEHLAALMLQTIGQARVNTVAPDLNGVSRTAIALKKLIAGAEFVSGEIVQ
ncbi:MAG TPA: glycosyltransferase [Blastocatellia bacterium]|nr:glycosyltransferase [Blastocatellia bacterium]